MDIIDGYQRRQTTPEEQYLYDYWLDRVQAESPAQLLQDFHSLFVEGRRFKEANVYQALEKIVRYRDAEEKFTYFLNRCCYILINRWQMQPQLHFAILELIKLLENLSATRGGYGSTSYHLQRLVKTFTQSDQYIKLQRLARVIDCRNSNQVNSIGNLIYRYPYLYDHCLLSEDSSYEHQRAIRHIKAHTERRFEVNLSRYVTYKVRLAQMTRFPDNSSGRVIRPVRNPTLLKERELNKTLKRFVGTVEGGYTYRSLSQNFLNHTANTPTFKAFKEDLYEYISGSLDSTYGQSQLAPKLYNFLQDIFPDCSGQKPSEFLILRTSNQLVNFLVVESTHQPEHYLFVDMITNLGVSNTIGLLLKLLLICRKVKPTLEKRLSILFNHYESYTSDGVPWLVKALEYLQIALSIHFGKVDLSCLRQIAN